jgi:hypothetical protein
MRRTVLFLAILSLTFTTACAGGTNAQHYAGNWETLKYSDYAAVMPIQHMGR